MRRGDDMCLDGRVAANVGELAESRDSGRAGAAVGRDQKGEAVTQALMQSDLLFYSLVYLLVVFAAGFVAACLESALRKEERDDPR
jgi:hypothetical protein